MKAPQLGRQELLTWINEFTECDYPRVELLSDGIAYCQVIDAIHPGIVHLNQLNYNARYPEDFERNLKVLDDAFSKLHIEKVITIDKLSKQKFSENMAFLQWLLSYAQKVGPFSMKTYKGYQKRQQAFEKQQHGSYAQMSAHLIPNTEFFKFKKHQYNQIENNNEYEQINQVGSMSNQLNRKIQYLEETTTQLEGDLKNRMEYNWKLIYGIDDMVYQRDVLFRILSQIENCISSCKQKSSIGEKLMDIIKELPEDLQTKD